jgi:hypothetical protein
MIVDQTTIIKRVNDMEHIGIQVSGTEVYVVHKPTTASEPQMNTCEKALITLSEKCNKMQKQITARDEYIAASKDINRCPNVLIAHSYNPASENCELYRLLKAIEDADKEAKSD